MGHIAVVVFLMVTILSIPYAVFADSDTGFDVKKHGFSFDNTAWGKVCYTVVGGTKLRYDANSPFCSGEWGLCGGMSLLAGERFRAGMTSHDLTQGAVKQDVVNAQFRTLDEKTVAKFLEWIASPDVGHTLDPHHSIGYRMKEDWNNLIKPRLDRREPVVLGLIFDKHARLVDLRAVGALHDLAKQHQILGIGYTMSGSTVKIRAYDPNYHDEVLELTFTLGKTGTSQRLLSGNALGSKRRTPRGIMFVRGITAAGATAPICPSGKFSTTGQYHGCTCTKGTKKYGGIGNSEAWCEGAEACPSGKFSTTGAHRGCYCAKGNKKYGGIGNSEAWCEGAETCPSGKFSTTGKWRGCHCPEGKKKKYHGVFDQEAECK
jgi:hypothetical protein